MDCRHNREVAGEQADSQVVVPSKGLEPPHPCGYMDLNHARLPIPPRWQKNKCGRLYGPPSRQELEIYSTERRQGVKPCVPRPARSQPSIEIATERLLPAWLAYPSSLAFIVILAFSTFETGHPVLASFAAFSKAAASAPGTRPTTSR
jgi:hypothetical protein